MHSINDNWPTTRTSLLERLKEWRNASSWQTFFDAYAKLIYRAARNHGLDDQEAQDVVQDTLVSVAKYIGRFRYDKSRGSFKSWLCAIIKSRIVDHIRRNGHGRACLVWTNPAAGARGMAEQICNPACSDFESRWEREWQENLLELATKNVKQRVNAKHFQVFDCCVRLHWSAAQVAVRLQVKPEQVYVIKHRITAMIKREFQRLEKELG